VAPDILGQLADGYHWKGMDKEAVEMLARQISAEEDLPLSAAVRRAFETGGYTAVVRCRLAAVEKEGANRKSFYFRACRPAREGSVSTMRLLPCSSKV
jgi:hypothetical protein